MSLPKGFILTDDAKLDSASFSQMRSYALKRIVEEAVYRKDGEEDVPFSKILNDEMSFTETSTVLNLTFRLFEMPTGDIHVQPSVPLQDSYFQVLKHIGVMKADSFIQNDEDAFGEVPLFNQNILAGWVPDPTQYPSYEERFRKLLIKVYYKKLTSATTFVTMTPEDFTSWDKNTEPGGLLLMHLPLSYVYPEVVEESVVQCETVIKRNPVYTD